MHHFLRFGDGHTFVAEQFFNCEAHHHAAAVTDGVFRIFDDFAEQSHAIFQRAAIFVSALIATTLQEMHRETEIVTGVDVHQVKAGGPPANCRFTMPAAVLANVILRHRARLMRIAVLERLMRRRQRHLARVQIGRRGAIVRELDRRQRPVCVHAIAHQRQRGYVSVVPQPCFDVRRDITARVNLTLLRRHHRPAAFRLCFAHRGVRGWHLVAHAIAVRYLKESVARGDGADLHRFEQDVVARITRHAVTANYKPYDASAKNSGREMSSA